MHDEQNLLPGDYTANEPMQHFSPYLVEISRKNKKSREKAPQNFHRSWEIKGELAAGD